jgi:hypothetical protein
LRGTKENPKNPNEVLAKHKAEIPKKESDSKRAEFKPKAKDEEKSRGDQAPGKSSTAKKPAKKQYPKSNGKTPVVEKVKYNFGKNKKA